MTGLKFGLISLGSKSSQMLIDEAKNVFAVADMIDLRKIEIRIDKKTEVLYDGEVLKDYDCLYIKGSYKYASLLYGLSEIYKDKCFIPIDSQAHIIAHNKFLNHLHFSSEKLLKMPATYFAANVSETKEFLKTLNYPIILKIPSGTHGKGVIFAESNASASSMIDALEIFKQPVIIQDYINVKSDIRVIVAGEKIVGSMRRIAKQGEVRANAHQGGEAEPFIVTTEMKSMCIEASKKIKASICAIDIVESDYGPLILEVNTSPGLQKITEVTKKNIAIEIVEYLYEETKKLREIKDKKNSLNIMDEMNLDNVISKEFEVNIKLVNDKILLPEFISKLSKLKDGEEVICKIQNGKIELIRQ